MSLLRSDEMTNSYKEYQASHPSDGTCALCDKLPLQNFTYWKIIRNEFPYDLIALEHNMIVPFRHVSESNLNEDELKELTSIKANLDSKYDFIIEATTKNKSIPAHYHLHLIVIKNSII